VYPKNRPRGFHELEFIARFFDAVEINTSFYGLLRPEISRLWIKKVEQNPKFLFCAKLNRRFTHDRVLDADEIRSFKQGLKPFTDGRKFGCLLMQFPWTFRYTEENRAFFIKVRRAFGEFPLAAEMRHSSWSHDEAIGTLIDHRVAFCNIDQAAYTKAMGPTELVTSPIVYVRLHGRNPRDWTQEFERAARPAPRHDYLYTAAELSEWRARIDRMLPYASSAFVFMNNDVGGKAIVNGIQLAELLGDDRRRTPADLARRYPVEMAGLKPDGPVQPYLFAA
jgi:uncharacterized protein YecE (DUF72 family)